MSPGGSRDPFPGRRPGEFSRWMRNALKSRLASSSARARAASSGIACVSTRVMAAPGGSRRTFDIGSDDLDEEDNNAVDLLQRNRHI